MLIVDEDREDLLADVAKRVSTAANERPDQQIAVLAPRRALRALTEHLALEQVPTQVFERRVIRLEEPSVKLLTQQSAKRLDFPLVFVLPAEPNRRLSSDDLLTS